MPALTTVPAFPSDVPTHSLIVIDYQLLQAGSNDEMAKLWHAATHLGFWYLSNHGVDREVNAMFDVGAETLALPLAEKMKFEQGDTGDSFGYKARGTIATDLSGTRDTVEFLNIAQDDAVSWPRPIHRTYPSTVNARMQDAVIPFVRKSMAVNNTILSILERLLGLPRGSLANLHATHEPCGSEARVVKTPPNQSTAGIGAHTDFGTLTFLHNRLGGLQVMPPGSQEWLYVKPLPGHAICNIGDALSIFSGGILRSNLHRVMPPPGHQSRYERYSVAFFTRPNNNTILRPLTDKSRLIADAAAKNPREEFSSGATAGEWTARRIRKLRLRNRKGPETWYEAKGTEHQGLRHGPETVRATA
ncbi:Clavaminate synthase-like protein [Dichomitus squalens]|uniref:Clavaminate synthase-like protein n=1 Tax=Dichomitus squalens TaxID=114155 RepID=A0A4Q9Q7F6_9APHY|nr:Clavaminate synthase-like protein [Dichomitus squalens]TBU46159.1 Clavaminate synthase-like protein [Dichomitus squalens]TBU62534.1 Clavaminate synthase-like protein [Dichomitus squalens]